MTEGQRARGSVMASVVLLILQLSLCTAAIDHDQARASSHAAGATQPYETADQAGRADNSSTTNRLFAPTALRLTGAEKGLLGHVARLRPATNCRLVGTTQRYGCP